MRFIEEIVVDDFLPTFRSLLADALRERGLTQSEVADLLGISQSAVSKYVHGDVARHEDLLAHRGLEELVERLADGLADGDMSSVQALVETEVFIRELEQGGVLAQLHEDAVPELGDYDDEFAVHDPDSQLRSAERTLASVRRGLSVLENTSGFATLIPAVGSNLVQCLPEADSIEDVAAVPGRILDVKGRATIPADPEFGVSEHVASLLLAARAAGSDARAVLNVRYDDGVVTALRDAGRTVVEFDAEESVEPAVAAALADDPGADVLYHTGAMGIEPVVYLLGDDAVAVAETAREIL
ncbi:helix-turn-helix domain-containing protein [Haloarcula sp. JP-Z28]|jgi:predicted fused transcriptional regulator/phosphomethylpyrimidine kinase/predicted transcriptional regulator|uniref:DNA binding protein n=1 Tax=Haloarcula marismortui (strain ATCC 43049 / DSM 3752 / JCM 8966 / VKM B-1809) TaxID=272569 RepID=Q5V1D0_HALMA|nr:MULTISPECIES: thiamine-phosphate synthase family protein [Haloarcula]AAV46672.1 DNA binding protein [Haloarcula marismortui ATCC 43049]NHN61725.1 helix-turn-helix domain-containing protein [Haloarcula sp. JP-Z28]QCP91383.1 helix-turn-helix domain-containing protein [Haloarcula marismortui ATCC 43049]